MRVLAKEKFPTSETMFKSPLSTFKPGLGQAQAGAGELYITQQLKEVNREIQGLSAFPFYDIPGHKKAIARLEKLVEAANNYLGEPKRSAFIQELMVVVNKQKEYNKEGRISSAKNRMSKKTTKLLGILKVPSPITRPPKMVPTAAQIKMPVTKPGMDYKKIIVGAGIATAVGITITALMKKMK